MASLILGSVGSALLGPIGGFIGSAIGSAIDQYLFAPKPADIEGPRLSDLKTISSDPGTPIPLVYGADRIPGIVVQTTDLIETKHKQKVGGKGGGKSQSQISYTYHVDITYLLCEGPILGIGRIWADGKLLRGTRYQMELDTEANFEQIGGIPYNSWYKDDIYVPSDLHWSFNPDYNGNIANQKYEWDQPTNNFIAISDEYAQTLLDETKEVVYAYDTVVQKYLPIPASHDYTGEVISPSDPVLKSGSAGIDTPEFKVPDGVSDGESVTTYFNFLPFLPAELAAADHENTAIGTATFSFGVASEYIPDDGPFPDYGWNATNNSNFGVGRDDDGDGTLSGYPGSTGSASGGTRTPGRLEGSPPDDTPVSRVLSDTVTLFRGDRVAKLTQTMARFLAFANRINVSKGSISVNWTYTEPAPEIRDWPDYYNFYDAINDWSPKSVLEFHASEGVAVYRGYEDQIADPTMAANSPTGDTPAYICRAAITFSRLELEQFGNRIPNLTFEVVQSDNARITDVLTDLMDRSGVDSAHYDIDEVPTTGEESYVHGYSIGTITSYRAAMEPMMEAFELDASEIGNQIVFRPKHRLPEHTIDYNDLATVEVGNGPDPAIRLSFRDVVEMPRSLAMRFKDPEREYQPQSALFTRQIGRSVQASVIEIGAVLPPHRMKGLVRDKMRDLWLERQAGAWKLPHKYLYISPSDIVSITNVPNEDDLTFKVTQLTRLASGILEMEGVARDNELYVPQDGETDNTSVARDIYPGQEINVTGQSSLTKAYFLDLPPLLDVTQTDNYQSCGIYYAPNGPYNTWPGCTLYRDTFEENEVIELEELSTHYVASSTGILLNTTELNYLNNDVNLGAVDYDSEVYVFLDNTQDSLASISPAQLFDGGNTAVIGDEIVNFQKAELQGDGSYKLSIFLRARLDTEDVATSHDINERFVLLDLDETYDVPLSVDLVGQTVDLYSDTFGTVGNPNVWLTEDGVAILSALSPGNGRLEPFNGRRLKPFRPVQLEGTRDASDNITITWRRQDRHDRGVYDGTDLFITEQGYAHAWEMDIFPAGAGPTDLTLLRTVEIDLMPDASNSFVYTAAMQSADGYGAGAEFTVYLYQMSGIVGRGNPGSGTF